MRTALPFLFIAAVYSGGPFYDLFGWGTDWPTWGTLLLIAGIANILCACFDRAEDNLRRLAFWDLILKLCMIPFYTLIFLYATGIATIMFVIPGLFLAAPFVVVPLLAMSYLLMLATSSYGFAASLRAAKRGLLPRSLAAIHIALHFFAVADFFSAAVLYLQLRRADKARKAHAEASAGTPTQHPADVQ
ncbi:hypothetical protein [Actinomyces sp. oral taxon 181]|uniref:hypothetical protein n=1 Tax=Actinomyces sp. oral taxon 181 TaxID=712121 RepID=UPI001F2034FD|nr:hypothetical protein [Actinomyces sp. oral taxon 181]